MLANSPACGVGSFMLRNGIGVAGELSLRLL